MNMHNSPPQKTTAKLQSQPLFFDSANSFILRLASTQSTHRNPRRPPLASVVVVVDSVVVVVDSVVVAASTKFAPAAPWT